MKPKYYLATLALTVGGFGIGTYLVPQRGELAMIYYRSGQLDQARSLLEHEMDTGDLSATNVHYATQTYIRLGDVDRAIALVERYVAAHPDDVRARRILSVYYLDTNRQALHIANLEAIERLEPDPKQRIELTWLYRAAGSYDKWAAMLERLVAEDIASPEEYYQLAQIHAAAGRRDAALAVLDLLEQRRPGDLTVSAYEMRISMELDERRPGRALEWARKGVEKIPGDGTVLTFSSLFQRRGHSMLALDLLEPYGGAAMQNPALLRALVWLEIGQGKAAQALERLRAVDKVGKLTGVDRNMLISAALTARDWDTAKAAFEATDFADVSQSALDRMASEAVSRDDREGVRLILSRASNEFLTEFPVTAARLYLKLDDRTTALRWADEAFKNTDLTTGDRIDLAGLYIELDNRDRSRDLLKSLTTNDEVPEEVALELAGLYLKLELAADGLALFDRVTKKNKAPRLAAARTLLDAQVRPAARDWDLAWLPAGTSPDGRNDLAVSAYWAAMNAKLYALGAAIGKFEFENNRTNDTQLRYARALSMSGETALAMKLAEPLLAESADARSIYSVALIEAVKAGTAREEDARAFITLQLNDSSLTVIEKKWIIAALIEAKALNIVLPILEETMRRGQRDFVDSYVWALSTIRDKKELRTVLQRELARADDRIKLGALATVAFQESLLDVARGAYLRLLKDEPRNLDALKRLGQMAFWGEDTSGARRYLEAFMAAGGDDYHIDYTLGEVIILFPNWQNATPHYQRAMAKIDKLEKPTLEDRMLRAKLFYRLGRFNESIAAYEALLRQYPRDRALRDEYSDVLIDMGRYDRAQQLRGGRLER